jgi:hypothetical protein
MVLGHPTVCVVYPIIHVFHMCTRPLYCRLYSTYTSEGHTVFDTGLMLIWGCQFIVELYLIYSPMACNAGMTFLLRVRLPCTNNPLFRRHLKVHSYHGGRGGLQLPLIRVRATRQHGDWRGRPTESGLGLQKGHARFKTENGLSARSEIRGKCRKPSGGRWNCGGRCRKVVLRSAARL